MYKKDSLINALFLPSHAVCSQVAVVSLLLLLLWVGGGDAGPLQDAPVWVVSPLLQRLLANLLPPVGLLLLPGLPPLLQEHCLSTATPPHLHTLEGEIP